MKAVIGRWLLVVGNCVPLIVSAQATDTTRLEAVVVTATRNPLSIGDIPASVTVLSGADLRARGVLAVSDALQEVPGVTIARTGSFGGQTSLFVRGGQSNYTKILIDGVPVNQSGGAFDLSTLTTDNVERIEIVRGPSSVVWGSDAVTGVINIITRSGRGGPRMSVTASGGTYGTMNADAAIAQSSASSAYSLGIGRHSSTGIYAFNDQNGAFNNQYGETVLSGRADAAIDDKTSSSFTLRYVDFVAHYPTDGTGAIVDSNSYNTATQLAVSARIRRLLNSWLTVQGTLTSSSHDGGTDDALGRGNTSSFETLDHITRRGVEGRGIAALGAGSVLTVGGQLEEQSQRTQQQFISGNFISPAEFTDTRHDHAAFGELVSTMSKLTTTAGARVDGNPEFGTFGTFRVAGQYTLAGTTTLRGSVGTAFREPSLDENFSTGFVVGNPNLKPEHTQSWELGAGTGIHADVVHFQLTYFNQRFVDLIDYNGSVPAGQPNYENIAKASANGVEFEMHHAPVMGFAMDASVTWLDTKVINRGFSTATTATLVQGQRLLRRPTWSGSLHASYQGITRLRMDGVYTYVGDRDDRLFLNSAPFTQADTLKAHSLVDLSAEYSLPKSDKAKPDVALTLRAANVGNLKYKSVAGFTAPRRTILLGAEISR